MQRLDQINAFKPANLSDFKSLTLKFRREQIDRFKIVTRPERHFDLVPTRTKPVARRTLRVRVPWRFWVDVVSR